jgi:hypothetical protein
MKKKGSIYALALSASLVLTAVVLGISYQILQFRRTSRANTQTDQASVHAGLGIRHALHYTSVDANWRQNLNSGPWLQDIAVGDALYSVEGIDPVDGVLVNNDTDPVELTCTATVYGVTRTVQVNAQSKPCDLLQYAVAAGSDVKISNNVHIHGDVTSNAKIDKSGSSTWIYGNAEAVDTIGDTSQITGTISPNSAAKDFPDESKIFAYYQAGATPIAFQPLMQRILLSPTSNPFGPLTNADGLYKINCANQKIVIKNCRIVGTLFLINPKDDSRIETSINWQLARPDYPALIIDGTKFEIITDRDLEEEEIGFVDLNLPGEPGFGSVFTVFPNEINGLIYCKGNLTLDKNIVINGIVIATGVLDIKDYSHCTADPALYSNPTIGFVHEYLVPVPGTWRQVLPPAN